MKKILFVAFCVVALSMLATDQFGKSIAIYLKNGEIAIVDPQSLDGIFTSYYDKDGVEQNRPQYIDVCDTSYSNVKQIRIEDIDSIVFAQNDSKILNDNVKEITSDTEYILGYEGNIVTYKTDTPATILPNVGQKIVYESMTDMFPDGLCAEVSEVKKTDSGIKVFVRNVAPSEVYGEYVVYSDFEGSDTQDIKSAEIEEVEYTGDLLDDDDAYLQVSKALPRRATVFDGQHTYNMKASVKISTSKFRYDILSGDFVAKINLNIDADYDINIDYPDGKDRAYSTNNSILVPLTYNNPNNRKLFDVGMKMSVLFKIKAVSGKIKTKLHRTYTLSYIMRKEDDRIDIYDMSIKPAGKMAAQYEEDSYINGSVSLMSSFSLDIRNIYQQNGIRTILTTGPTLKGSIGKTELESMTAEYKKDLYETGYNTVVISGSLKGYKTTYEKNKVVSAEKLTDSFKGSLKATHNDDKHFFFPQFSALESNVSPGSYSMKADCNTLLIRSVGVGCEVTANDGGKTFARQVNAAILSGNTTGQTTPISGNIIPAITVSQVDDCKIRTLIDYAGYTIKGPDAVHSECGDGHSPHPHAIDLGLSSGTKWACCHVGATTPEGYGNGFRFYSPYHDSTWDSSWTKPTVSQVRELKNQCHWTETTSAGVVGWKVTGPNGNSIFIPNSGFLSDNFDKDQVRYNAGHCCYIWTSSYGGGLGIHCRFTDGWDAETETYEPYKALFYVEDPDPVTDFCSLRLVKK